MLGAGIIQYAKYDACMVTLVRSALFIQIKVLSV